MSVSPKAIVATLGCKVNQLESAAFVSALEEAGVKVVSEKNQADIVIVNTCAVTETAGSQSRQKLRRLLRKNPLARVYLTGCHAEEAAQQLAAMPEVQDRKFSLFGNSKKDQLISAVLAGKTSFQPGRIMEANEIVRLPINRFPGRTRAYLRIQDGCQAFCSYCIVPYTRGPSRSLPVPEVVGQAKKFAEAGHKELVLTGIHLGYYGADLDPQQNLINLLTVLTDKLPQMRWRISSLEPLELTSSLLQLISDRPAIRPHLHIPLQSGCDTILNKMNRRYTTAQFAEIVETCHQKLDNLAIGIDILAGFPGESDIDFKQSFKFVESLDISYLHVFPYSRRPGTSAADFPGQIFREVKRNRTKQLRNLGEQKRKKFYKNQLGLIRPALFEGKRDTNGLLKGVTDNYIPVRMRGPDLFLRQEIPVRLVSFAEKYIICELPEENHATKS